MTAAEALEEKLVVPDAAELVTATATAQSSCALIPAPPRPGPSPPEEWGGVAWCGGTSLLGSA